MYHDKIIKKEDGSSVKITARVTITVSGSHNYSVSVRIRSKGKRNWDPVFDSNKYSFTTMTPSERTLYIKNKQLEHVSEHDIMIAKVELWEKLNPIKNNDTCY